MALAFAGPLSRWFTRMGGDAARVRDGIVAWREDLCRAVAPKVAADLHWDEAAAVAATAELGDSGWLALRLLAFLADRSELDWPDTVPPLLELVPEWRAAAEAKFATSRYGHLLACEMWLPGDFPVSFRVPAPDGANVEIGSLGVLADQLRWLNQRTFQAAADELLAWREQPAPSGGAFLPAAQRGLGVMTAVVGAAVAARLPVVLQPA